MAAIGQEGSFNVQKKKKNHAWPIAAIDHHAPRHFTFQHGVSYQEEDQTLEETLKRYVNDQLRPEEILDFMSRDFEQCALNTAYQAMDNRLVAFLVSEHEQ